MVVFIPLSISHSTDRETGKKELEQLDQIPRIRTWTLSPKIVFGST